MSKPKEPPSPDKSRHPDAAQKEPPRTEPAGAPREVPRTDAAQSSSITKPDIALLFEEMAEILDILGENPFKVRSFQNAARAIESLPGDSLFDTAWYAVPNPVDTMTITRTGGERLFRFSFELARRRKAAGRPGLVTCVDKANVLGAFAFFRGIFDEVACGYPDIEADHCYVDAMALNLVKRPWALDVLVTENMFGDILSDLGAALMGGMGLAPSADIGAEHAVFQPCHGSAPDIAGKGTANPTATFLSAAMMFEWLGDRHKDARATATGRLISTAVEQAFAGGDLVPVELDGPAGTEAITARVLGHIPGATNSRLARGHAADGR